MAGLISLFTDYTFQVVALGAGLLGAISGGLGCFAVLRGQSLLGDAVSHAALPGVVLAFLIIGSKETEVLLFGGLITALLSALVVTFITQNTPIKFDGAMAMTLAIFFGLAMMLLSQAQKIPNANQAGLSRFIYGQASAILLGDIYLILLCGGVLLAVVLLLWKEFALLSFDPQFSRAIGHPTRLLDGLLTLLIVVAIVVGLQTVGVILMSAMLVAPAVAARQWVNRLGSMVVLASLLGAVAGVAGTALSSTLSNMPTGPMIVVCASAIAIFSLLAAPQSGVIYQLYRRHKNRERLSQQRGDF